MGNTLGKEIKLAKRLQLLCDDGGKEMNPQMSAKVLSEFGFLYKEKSPDKISLIFSATFLNAAIVRQPFNTKFKKDLQHLCDHVLQVAGAKQLQADLCAISDTASRKVHEMRERTNTRLKEINIIPIGLPEEKLVQLQKKQINQVRRLQNEITQKYTSLMEYIGRNSIQIMGDPPCQYSITGMGSLARKEITPFSDFEHIILLEEGVQRKENYEEILEYFRWVSVIFHIIIINLKESIVRSVAVPWLNDDSIRGGDWFFDAYTTCGIKFDGMQLPACKIPLGRTRETDNKPFTVELIKPVSEMAKYLELEEDVKNGYHLADVLTKTCFVCGEKDVHVAFRDYVEQLFVRDEWCHKQLMTEEVKVYLKDFDAVDSNLTDMPTCNIKRVLYRTSTLFISALGRLCSMSSHSCFDIIDELFEKEFICIETKHQLLYMISISCTARLKIYMQKKGQDDFIEHKSLNFQESKPTFNRVSDIIGEQKLGDYVLITSALQQAFKKRLSFPLMWKEMEVEDRLKFSILHSYYLHDRTVDEWKKYLKRRNPKHLQIVQVDAAVPFMAADGLRESERYEQALPMYFHLYDNQLVTFEMKVRSIRGLCRCLIGLKRFREGLKYATLGKSQVQNGNLSPGETVKSLGDFSKDKGECEMSLQLYDEAIKSFTEASKHYLDPDYSSHVESYPIKPSVLFNIPAEKVAICYGFIATCNIALMRIEEALISYSIAAITLLTINDKTGMLTGLYVALATCYTLMGKIAAAKNYLEEAINRRCYFDNNVNPDSDKMTKDCRSSLNDLNNLL